MRNSSASMILPSVWGACCCAALAHPAAGAEHAGEVLPANSAATPVALRSSIGQRQEGRAIVVRQLSLQERQQLRQQVRAQRNTASLPQNP